MQEAERYVNEIMEYPLLTYKREKELANTIRKFKSGKQKQSAREELVTGNLRLVVKIAYKYKDFFNISIMDLIGSGNKGLIKAVDLYNPKKFETRFSTWAYPLIRQNIFRMLYDFGAPVRIPLHIVDQSRLYKKLIESDLEITDEELIETMGITESALRKVKMARTRAISLDKEVYNSEGSDKSIRLEQILADPKSIMSDKKFAESERKSTIHDELNNLDAVDKDIIIGLFFNDETLRDVGNRHGITPEAVRQRKRKALRKMRLRLKNKVSIEI